ncbi:MAG: methyltransferase domain-containing protein [Candidatus Omnitrophica bacterium]|nr:methyltransferase domain-containing protein [Candidatus Omnitrophota bacterium]
MTPSLFTLDLGCGRNKHNPSIGIDIDLGSAADIICDLNHFPYPLRKSSFGRVISKQVLEHLDNLEDVLAEIHRVCQDKSKVIIEVPHFSCYLSYADPAHKRAFSVFAFDKIAPEKGFKVLVRKITFHRAFRRYLIQKLANRFPRGYERFWAFIFPAEHLHFELEVIKNP